MQHTIPLDALIAHSCNANVMPADLFRKLRAHIKRTGKYPPLIVRPHRSADAMESFQILDGHHRARALREIGATHACCEVWEVDDREAAILLLTLNRLEGADDPRKRAHLVEHLRSIDPWLKDARDLAKFIPEDAAAVGRLLALVPPPKFVTDQRLAAIDFDREPVTFFFTRAQRSRVLDRLADVGGDRSGALLRLLDLEGEDEAHE